MDVPGPGGRPAIDAIGDIDPSAYILTLFPKYRDTAGMLPTWGTRSASCSPRANCWQRCGVPWSGWDRARPSFGAAHVTGGDAGKNVVELAARR
jgi:hypothetical protein